jgi:hypothetical protein
MGVGTANDPTDERSQGLDMAGFVPGGVSKELHQNGMYGTIVAVGIAHGRVISFLGKLKEMIPGNAPYSVNWDMNMFSVG